MRRTGGILWQSWDWILTGAVERAGDGGFRRRGRGAAASFDKERRGRRYWGADSAFVRAMMAKNVDSLMPYYDASVVSDVRGHQGGEGDERRSGSYNESSQGEPAGP